MRKCVFLFSFLLLTVCALAQTDTVRINCTTFIAVKHIVKNEDFDTRKDTLLKFYRVENSKPHYLLSHYLYRYGADCNNEFQTIGSYRVQNDSLVFTTEFLQKTGMDPLPVMQKQVYQVAANGKLTKVYDMQQERSGKWVATENNH